MEFSSKFYPEENILFPLGSTEENFGYPPVYEIDRSQGDNKMNHFIYFSEKYYPVYFCTMLNFIGKYFTYLYWSTKVKISPRKTGFLKKFI